MGETSKLIVKINNRLSQYTKQFKDEFYNPKTISPQMPENDYKKIYLPMKNFDEKYAEFVKLKDSNPENKSETLKSIRKAMTEAGNEVLNFYSQFDDYSIYRDTLSKVGAQLTEVEEEVKKSNVTQTK